MGTTAPGKGDVRSAPFQKIYSSFAAAVDLTEEVTQAQGACSGMIVIVGAAGAGDLVWKDCAGTSATLALANSAVLDLPFAATSLEISTITGQVVVYWHPLLTR